MKLTIKTIHFNDTGLSMCYQKGDTIHYLMADPKQSTLLMCDTGYLQSRDFLSGRLVVKKMDWWYRFEELHLHYSVTPLWAERFIARHEENLLLKAALEGVMSLPVDIQLN